MVKLKNLFKLGSKVTVYIPSTIDVDKKTDNKKNIDETLILLSECFGGATSSNAVGSWVSNSNKLIKEDITIVFSYCTTNQLESNIEKIISYCENMKKEMVQEAIALEINGEMYFI